MLDLPCYFPRRGRGLHLWQIEFDSLFKPRALSTRLQRQLLKLGQRRILNQPLFSCLRTGNLTIDIKEEIV
jgi:hypothetical protein